MKEHLDKNNLHHAYLIEGEKEKILPEIFDFLEEINIKIAGNPDFYHITIDNFKIDEAFDLRAMSSDRGFSPSKKIFLLCVNTISLDAQNVLLKMFEEPILNTHFFLIVPDSNALLKTLVSRFYSVSARATLAEEAKNAEKFIAMSLRERIEYLKILLAEPEEEDEEGSEIVVTDSARSKALQFLNALELVLHRIFLSKTVFDTRFFEHFFRVRESLRMPGSATKTLMESVVLLIPEKI